MQADSSSSQGKAGTVAVVGLGKIGLPLAVQYARSGYKVIGCDIDARVVAYVNIGVSHIQEERELLVEVPRLVHDGLLSATSHTTEAVHEANVVVVVVPVSVDAEHRVDMTQINAATIAIGKGLRPGTLVIYETTLPVGTTSRHLRSLLERASGLTAGSDFHLAYSPERVSSRSIFRDLRIYPKVVGGLDTHSTARAVVFYQSVLDANVITMASTDDAEFVKLIETTYRDVNIALANEYACYADAHGLDVYNAIAAANTQPYSHIHTPGVGVGGHCIPVYPYFLFAHANQQQSIPSTLELPRQARRINDAMAAYAVQRIEGHIGSLCRQSVLILGVSYRGDVRETAFTSAQLLQEAFIQRGALVYVDDPLFSESELRALGYTPLPAKSENIIDAIILQCNHRVYQAFDFSRFIRCRVVLDGRHGLRREAVEAAGMHYSAIGDGSTVMSTEQQAAENFVKSITP